MFGAAASLTLARRGWSVTLLDRAKGPHPDASSTDISKMIRMDYGSDRFYHELAESALDGWDHWNSEWPDALYHPDGFLVLSSTPMAPGGFEFESHRVLTDRGYPPVRLNSATLAARYPLWNAARYPDGYVSPRGGWAESARVVARLIELGARAGVGFVQDRFAGLESRGSRIAGVRLASGASVAADVVVVAAGAWTPSLLPWLGGVLDCVAQPVLHFGVDDPGAWRAPHFPPFAADIAGTGWYGFPALPDGRIKLGHHGAGLRVEPDARGTVDPNHVAVARRFLAESIPALASAPLVGSRVCLYCDTFDGDLVIDRDPAREGLVVAAGGSGHAFKFAPLLGDLIADAVEDRSNPWLHRFRWRAQGDPSTEEARMTASHVSSEGRTA